jgi:hypothetical protein
VAADLAPMLAMPAEGLWIKILKSPFNWTEDSNGV